MTMWSLVISTIVYFVASFFVSRWLNEMGIPKTMTRGVMVFACSILLAYVAGALIDWIVRAP